MDIQYSFSERELAAERSVADGTRERGRLFASASLPMALVAASALLALIIGVALPPPVVEGVLKEGGLVENATVVVYAFAMLAIWLVRDPHFDRASAVASTVVLTACVAREISLRRWIIEAGDGTFCCAVETSASLAVIVVLALALASAWLVRRHAAQVWRGLLRRRPVPTTLFAIFCATALSQFFDRLPALLSGQSLPVRSALVALSLEEILELIIPALVIVAAFQAGVRKPRAAV